MADETAEESQPVSDQPPFEYQYRRNRNNNNNNLRAQVEELRTKVQQQEEAIRSIGVMFSSLSALRDHGFDTNRDRRNNYYAPQYNGGYSRRGRPN